MDHLLGATVEAKESAAAPAADGEKVLWVGFVVMTRRVCTYVTRGKPARLSVSQSIRLQPCTNNQHLVQGITSPEAQAVIVANAGWRLDSKARRK